MPGTRVTWIAQDGSVLFDSEADSAQMENHADRPEVQAAFSSGAGGGSRLSDTLRERTHYFAVRLADGTALRLSETHETALGSVYRMLWIFALLFGIMIVLCALVARQAARKLVDPINGLNLDDPEDNDVYDELAPLLIRLSRQGAHIREQMAQLETRQTEFTALVDNMAEGLVLLNANLRVPGREPQRAQSIRRRVRLPGRTFAQAHAGSRDCPDCGPRRRGRARCEQIVEIDGRQYQAMANPVKGGGVVLLMPDVSERYAAEHMRREFSANVSHELKTPLTTVAGYAELPLPGWPNRRTRRAWQKILDEAGRLLVLIDDIMRLSKLDEGAPDAQMQIVNLGETPKKRRNACARWRKSKASRLPWKGRFPGYGRARLVGRGKEIGAQPGG